MSSLAGREVKSTFRGQNRRGSQADTPSPHCHEALCLQDMGPGAAGLLGTRAQDLRLSPSAVHSWNSWNRTDEGWGLSGTLPRVGDDICLLAKRYSDVCVQSSDVGGKTMMCDIWSRFCLKEIDSSERQWRWQACQDPLKGVERMSRARGDARHSPDEPRGGAINTAQLGCPLSKSFPTSLPLC